MHIIRAWIYKSFSTEISSLSYIQAAQNSMLFCVFALSIENPSPQILQAADTSICVFHKSHNIFVCFRNLRMNIIRAWIFKSFSTEISSLTYLRAANNSMLFCVFAKFQIEASPKSGLSDHCQLRFPARKSFKPLTPQSVFQKSHNEDSLSLDLLPGLGNKHSLDSLRGSSVKIGRIQIRLAWPLRKDDTRKPRSVFCFCPPV